MKGYAINQLIDTMLSIHEKKNTRLNEHERRINECSDKIDFFVQTSLPPAQGIFFDGQIYDAYAFVAGLVRKATRRIILIDNYVDETVLTMMDKRADAVTATIYKYPPVVVRTFSKAHDRFLVIDEKVYLIGASIKDLGKKWFGFTLMENTPADELLERI